MDKQVNIDASARADQKEHDGVHEIATDVACKRLLMVNVCFFGTPGQSEWALIDAGIPGTAPLIAEAAGKLFGSDSAPVAIILTHGHFDHVGALHALAEKWNVPIYAHEVEIRSGRGSPLIPTTHPLV